MTDVRNSVSLISDLPMGNILLTICARGGSEGVKNKNIRKLGRYPLIAHTIRQAKKWGRANRIVVSTDSANISDVSRDFGAEVPFVRPAELATSEAGKVDVIKHALKTCEDIYNEQYSIVVDLDPTAPVRDSKDLDSALKLFEEERPKTLMSVVRSRKNPYFNMVEVDDSNRVSLSKPVNTSIMSRQKAPIVYSLNASIYIYDRKFLTSTGTSCMTDDSIMYEMSEESSIDIDREIDFRFVEYLVREKLISLY